MECTENTPPPEDCQRWYDELYADLPDLPDAWVDPLRSKYDLRMGVRENNIVPVTYLDQDESGTFDPANKMPPKCTPINRKKRERRECINGGPPKKPKTNTWQGGRWLGRQLPVMLTFTSEKGQAALKEFGISLDNWPERLPHPDSSDDSPTDWPELQAQSYEFRERRRSDLSDSTNAAGDDAPHSEDITLGYPAYRGCKGCFQWGSRCPLLDEGSRYPCAECAATNADCELIAEPAVKRSCEGYRSRRQHCSYRERGGDHKKPCQQCANASRKCVAGPASGRTRTGPSLDQGGSRHSLRPRREKIQTRNESSDPRKKQKSRSRRPKQATTSIKGREKEHGVCIHKRSKPAATEPAKRNRCRTITTKLAHPIQFNFAYDDDAGTAPCHWCEDAVYGILGLGVVEVEVIDNEDGQGFIEIVDGHTETYGHSRMCEFCTTERLKITACNNHEIEPIEGMDPEKFDHKAAVEWMMPGMASLAPFAWCSVCPSPAFFSCCTKPDIDLDGQDADLYLRNQKGCGLVLCESCAVTLVSEHEGKLDKLINSLENDDGDGRFGIRADASFLHSKGELLRREGGF